MNYYCYWVSELSYYFCCLHRGLYHLTTESLNHYHNIIIVKDLSLTQFMDYENH